jgi:hypothetical protein
MQISDHHYRKSMKSSYRIALFCGGFPLITGISIFALWCLLRWDVLMLCGMVNILVGLILFLTGTVFLLRFLSDGCESKLIKERRVIIELVVVGSLLLANFPVAVVLVVAADRVRSRYVVTIVNESNQRIDDLHVTGGGIDANFGSVFPATSKKRGFNIKHDDELIFLGMRGGEPVQGQRMFNSCYRETYVHLTHKTCQRNSSTDRFRGCDCLQA